MTTNGTDIPNFRQDFSLEQRGFVVLGGGDGIGRQTCHALAQAGATVMCVDRDALLSQTVAEEISGFPMVADVTQRKDLEGVFRAATDRFGSRLHGVVDIVGVCHPGRLIDLDDEGWRRQFDIVLDHAFLAIQLGGTALAKRGGGSLTFVGSIAGSVSVNHQAAYGAAKAALHHLVRSSAHELGPAGVRVNAVSPGFVKTPRLLQRLDANFWQKAADSNPLKRVALPADVARAILFLASDLAAYVTGNIMTLDGGVGHVAALPDIL